MANWQLGEKDKARAWYDRAVQWMDKNEPKNEELRRFRTEAAELLGVNETSAGNNDIDFRKLDSAGTFAAQHREMECCHAVRGRYAVVHV